MHFKPGQHQYTSLSRLPQILHPQGGQAQLHDCAFTRRQFMGAAAGAAGLALGSGFFSSAFAGDCADPRPIPGGNQLLFPDPRVFHIFLPGYPFFPINDPATNDPSVITDFVGQVGLSYVRGMGTHTDLTTGAVSHLPFEVDLRFMKGAFVGLDGRLHHGAFALI